MGKGNCKLEEIKQAISENYYVQNNQIFDKRQKNVVLSLNDVQTKVKIYEDRVDGWFLKIAEKLKQNNEAGFVILSVAIAYIEGNQQFREGKLSKNNSKKFFIRGIRRIFDKENVPDNISTDYYSQVRCGLFHDGMTKSNVMISGEFTNPLSYNEGIIKINPNKFLNKVKEDFQKYLVELENNKILRSSFIKRFDWENES